MGHDIYGYNKDGKEIAYARFSMWNDNATILYRLLDSMDYHGGVSGLGRSSAFDKEKIENALNSYTQLHNNIGNFMSGCDPFDLEQIQNFIQNCYTTAQKEGSVTVFFG
ncbi:hypothetical protein QA612_01515 [Evansella sp. AB-P1]|uniref:hypothetical protein n=1 Tax=Evansella sp. AB-P1 TaxID=3037653 RepID=UPI00241CF91C|nr:hypothetical protein [Evansella sp. AB-P1]MDG5786151.1 hypothetical protein [Evansella sp. AB-P1]